MGTSCRSCRPRRPARAAGQRRGDPSLVPLRHGRMLASPFAFYRGGALLMAADLAVLPRSGLTVQLCGDAHLANFGVYAAPDRRLVFSLNDFDETLPGPFEWDVERLAASFQIAARHRGFDRSTCDRDRVDGREVVPQGHARLRGDADARPLVRPLERRRDQRSFRRRRDPRARASGSTRRSARPRRRTACGRSRSSPSWSTASGGSGAILRRWSRSRTWCPRRTSTAWTDAVAAIIESFRSSLGPDRRRLLDKFRYVHVARKVVGVGSVGTRAWVLLLVGRDDDDPLLLQFKEAQPSVLEEFLGPSEFATHGQRIVAGQHLMQAASDILLGWHRGIGIDGVERDFFVRQLWDAKGSADLETIGAGGMKIYASVCGWTLARAHARSGDPAAIAGYLGDKRRIRPSDGGLRRPLRGSERARLRSRSARGRRRSPPRDRRLTPTAGAQGS